MAAVVRPGRGVGGLSLGMDRAELLDRLGAPDRIFEGATTFSAATAPDGAYHVYAEPGLRVRFVGERLDEITALGPDHHLAEGPGIRAPQADVIAALGEPEQRSSFTRKEVLRYPRRGLELVIDDQARILCFVVYPSRTAWGDAGGGVGPEASPPTAAGGLRGRPVPHYKRYHQARFFRSDGESPDSRVEAICYEENAHHRQLVELLNGLVFVDPGHGLAHAHRVATLCMAFYTLCEPDGEDAIRYYLMGFLHDLGRLSGGPEPEHGQRSVEAIRRLGVALSPPQLEAIRTHTTQREAQTLAEQCLFDADRLDLRRFGKELQPSLLSPALAGGLADFAPLADLFVRQRHCCFVPPNIRNRAAMRWLIYLHRHLDYLRPKRLFHGSLTPGIRQLRSPPMSYPIDGNCLFATPDPAEAAFIVWKWREPSRDTVSIYELPATGYREIEFNFLGIEFVFGEPVVPLGEYRVPFDPDRDPVTRYRQFRLPERWVDSPAGG